MFFQSTSIGTIQNEPGLFELFIAHLNSIDNLSVFEKIQVIVPNHAMSIWLKDRVTSHEGICANIDFVVLPGPVIENIYKANNHNEILFNFKNVKYIIYDFLCNNKLLTSDTQELNHYIYQNGQLDKYRVYQLASQLQDVFHEYLYLRTIDMINLDNSKFPQWQKLIIRHLVSHLQTQKSFLDIYKYFLDTDISTIKLPKRLFIFGLTSIYPSQLNINHQV